MILFLKFTRATLIVLFVLFLIDGLEVFTTVHGVGMVLLGTFIGAISYLLNKKDKDDLTK